MKSIFLLLLFIFTTLNSEYYTYHGNMIRNMGLRVLIACNYKKHKYAIQRLRNEYQKNKLLLQQNAKSKYMEYSNGYYSLSEEDRMIIETIVELVL